MTENATANVAQLPLPRRSIITAMADRYGMEAKPFESMMRAVALPKDATNEEFAACLMVAFEHHLNPITREIFFMRTKSGTIQPIVSVDGWVTKCNSHPQYDGIEFSDALDPNGELISITAKIHRKDRTRPTEVTEYMKECRGEGGGWKKTPARMLRHRSLMQAARYAFGFAGLMDQDEFEQWQADRQMRDITPRLPVEVPPIPEAPTPAETTEPVSGPAPGPGKAVFLNALARDLAAAETPEQISNLWEQRRELAEGLDASEEADALFDKREKELEAKEQTYEKQ